MATPRRMPRSAMRERAADASIRGEIEFRHLTFAYPTGAEGELGPPVLHDINLHVPGRLDARHRRPDRQRQIDARGSDRAACGKRRPERC